MSTFARKFLFFDNKKDGYVTESKEMVENEICINAWIDVKDKNHAPINNESDSEDEIN